MKSLQKLFLGASHNERYVTQVLLGQLFLLVILHLTEVIIYSFGQDQDIKIDLQHYFTFLIGYVYLVDGFRTKNALQLKFYILWLIAEVLISGLEFNSSVMARLTPSTKGLLVISILQTILLLVSMVIQIFYLKKVIGDCVWQGFRLTGADKERQQLWSTLQTYYVILKLTGIFFLPAYFSVLVGAKSFIINYGEMFPIFVLLTVVSLLAMVGFIICGMVFTRRESRLGMMLYFLLLLVVIVTNTLFAAYWVPSEDTLMGYVGAIAGVWCLLLLAYSIRIVMNFGKGLRNLFLLPPYQRELDLEGESEEEDLNKMDYQVEK